MKRTGSRRIGIGLNAGLTRLRISLTPPDALAIIYRPVRSAMTSGKRCTRNWVLEFERRTPPRIEPLMGWTAGDDTLVQVKLTLASCAAAVAYAEREGIDYRVRELSRS